MPSPSASSASDASVPCSSAATAGASQSASSRGAFVAGRRDREPRWRRPASATRRSSRAAAQRQCRAAAPVRVRRRRPCLPAQIATCARPRTSATRPPSADPDAGHRHTPRGLARGIHRMLMQQHLHLAQPAAPARRVGAGRQLRIDRAAHRGQRRRRQVGRHVLQDEPGVGPRRMEREAVVGEMGVERRDQRPASSASRSSMRAASATSLRPATSDTGSARSTYDVPGSSPAPSAASGAAPRTRGVPDERRTRRAIHARNDRRTRIAGEPGQRRRGSQRGAVDARADRVRRA